MGQALRLRVALRARLRDARDLLMTRRRGSSARVWYADDLRGSGGGGAGVLRDVGCDEGGPAWAGVDEGELLLVGVYDAAGAARALAAVSGHGCHVIEGGGDEAAVVAVRGVGGGEGC